MRQRIEGAVERVVAVRPGALELVVRCGDEARSAIAYTGLTGPVAVGDRVVLNTWAVELGLGTGGTDFVAYVDAEPRESDPPGHVMKLRYTPLQLPVLAAEAPESPHHAAVRDFCGLDTTPVVCAELHSHIAGVAAAAKWETRGAARVVYVMTDGAALPLPYSRLVASLREAGLIDSVVTCGQAYGGDFEAINIYSALAVARCAADADIIIVAQGPGNTGTETPLGFSGVDQGIALNAAAALDGTPIAVARLSFADPRPRHVGISHHTVTVLGTVATCCALVPLPHLPQPSSYHLRADVERAGLLDRHEFITVEAQGGLQALLSSGVPVTTMGRQVLEDEAFFLSAAASGLVAGQWYTGTRDNWDPVGRYPTGARR